MPPKKKQCIAPVNQEKLLEGFYNHLEDDTFLENEFFSENDDEVGDCELMSSDDGSNDDNTEGTGDLENDSDAREIHAIEVQSWTKHSETLSFFSTIYLHQSETELDYYHQKDFKDLNDLRML